MDDEELLQTNQKRQTFPLGQAQRRFLKSGDTGHYDSKKKAEDKIRNKLDDLEGRIQDLIIDLTLLYDSGILQNEWAFDWNQLLDVNPPDEIQPRNITMRYDRVHRRSQRDVQNKHVKFGFTMGCLIAYLYDCTEEECFYKDLLWGIMIGILGQESAKIAEEKEDIEEVIDWISKQCVWRYQRPPLDESYTEAMLEREQKLMEYSSVYVMPANRQSAIEREDIPMSEPLADVAFRNPNDLDMDYISSLSLILKELLEYVKEDVKKLTSRSDRDIKAKTVFEHQWDLDSGDPTTSYNISANNLGSNYKEIYGSLLNEMAAEEHKKDTFSERPLIQKKADSTTPRYLRTAYGDLVGYCLFEIEDILGWMHITAIDEIPGPEDDAGIPDSYQSSKHLLKSALEEVFLSDGVDN